MRGGAIHDRTTFVILCNASMKRNGQPATTDTLLSGRKAKINLHTTPKLTVVMPVSCLLPCADLGIFVRMGGGVHVNLTKKALTFFCFFFAFFLVLRLFNNLTEVKWLISKKNIIFQGSGGGTNFSRRGGAVHCLFPIETHITCDFPWGVRTPCPPLWIRTWLQSI